MRYLVTDVNGETADLGVERGLWSRRVDGEPIDLTGLVACSGLADAHIHLSSDQPDFVPSDPERIRSRMVAELAGGVFLCLDKGWSDSGVLAILDDPLAERPALRAAGPIVAGPGGYYPGAVDEVAPEDLVARVASHPRTGGWLKLIGDWPRKGIGAPPSFGLEPLTAAVDAAHAPRHAAGQYHPGDPVSSGHLALSARVLSFNNIVLTVIVNVTRRNLRWPVQVATNASVLSLTGRRCRRCTRCGTRRYNASTRNQGHVQRTATGVS